MDSGAGGKASLSRRRLSVWSLPRVTEAFDEARWYLLGWNGGGVGTAGWTISIIAIIIIAAIAWRVHNSR